MDKRYICYCGLYCENCAVRAKVPPAAKMLHQEMVKAEYEAIIPMLPNGVEFWSFLKSMAEEGTCESCQSGGGNPDCAVRICAREKGIEVCALCEQYPCPHFDELLSCYPIMAKDNAMLRESGFEEWAKLQDERRAKGFTYSDDKK